MEFSKLEVNSVIQKSNKIVRDTKCNRRIYIHTCDLCNKQYTSKDSLDFHYLSHTGERPVKCRLCLSRFKTKKCMRKHYNRIHTENFLKERQPTTCNICGLKITNMKRHLRTHTGEKRFKCAICNNRYSQMESLKYHIKSHTGERPYKCPECSFSFKTKKCARLHYMRIHNPKPENKKCTTVECHICNRQMSSVANLKRHLLTHTGEKPFGCSLCTNRYTSKNSLEYHLLSHTGSRPFKCLACGIGFKSRKLLKRHSLCHKIETSLKHSGTKFKTENHLNSLMTKSIIPEDIQSNIKVKKELISTGTENTNNEETSRNEFSVQLLKTEQDSIDIIEEKPLPLFSMNDDEELSKGMTIGDQNIRNNEPTEQPAKSFYTFGQNQEKPYECIKCSSLFETEEYVCSHYINIHNTHLPITKKSENLQCKICLMQLSSVANLSRHMRTHTGEKPFACSICGNRYSTKDSLNYHMVLHTGIKPFKCTECGSRFKSNNLLTRHTKKHTANTVSRKRQSLKYRKFANLQCNICSMQLSSTGSLNRHMRTHTGEKLFCCSICNNSYSTKDTLNYHMISHTGIKPFQCFECSSCFKSKKLLTRHARSHMANTLCKVQLKVNGPSDNNIKFMEEPTVVHNEIHSEIKAKIKVEDDIAI